MLTQSISNLNLEQLHNLIITIVDQRLKRHQNTQINPSKQELEQIFRSIDQNIWTPPSDAPSTLEMLQEERNQ
jgi:hypothetical protein